ncbi:hypothetical protein [Henriciella pelagia]|uniref:hypothetical protein n=1 Tax=Henriciella pelagia TaxID=1977912 RepID=UPI003513049B
MQDEIETILSGTDHTVRRVGPYWQIRVGLRAGAREDGVSLAHDLLRRFHEEAGTSASPVPTRSEPRVIVREVENPETVERLRATEQELAELKSRMDGVRAVPEFKFQKDFLEEERLPNESLGDTDRRLSDIYQDLQLRRPLSDHMEELRRRKLYSKLYTYKG